MHREACSCEDSEVKMRRLLILSFLMMLWGISACARGTTYPSSSLKTPVSSTLTQQPGIPRAVCRLRSVQPTPGDTETSLFPPAQETDWAKGPPDAYVTIIEYGDFQCAVCANLEPILARLMQQFPEDVRLIYRHFPLDIHDKAQQAARAAEAAGRQGRFWEMHDLLFAKRDAWVDLSTEEFAAWLEEQVSALGIDLAQFLNDIQSAAITSLVEQAWEYNARIGMPGTPFMLINGSPYVGPLSYTSLETIVKTILLEKRQFSDCPPMIIDPHKRYVAILHTTKGDIVIELYAEQAPVAVNNFIFLGKQGWYDGVMFHRVLPGYIAQAGDPSGTGFGGPGYAFDNEISPKLTFDGPGVVAMANAGPGTNGSQFFITYTAVPQLNGNYTIFGRVIAGMEVVESLTPRDPSQTMELPEGDVIISVTIEEYTD